MRESSGEPRALKLCMMSAKGLHKQTSVLFDRLVCDRHHYSASTLPSIVVTSGWFDAVGFAVRADKSSHASANGQKAIFVSNAICSLGEVEH